MTAALPEADREKSWVATSSLLAAILLTSLKLAIGIWTNSLGILSEAAHSGLDLVAAAVTLWAVRVSSQPADREHPYGHGKIENLSALFETVLLLVTCCWIVWEAAERLLGRHAAEINPNLWAFAVVVFSILIDYSRSRALRRAAEKYASQALEADALHFSTDIWSSAVVLLGLAGVAVGEGFGMPWLVKADAVAALGVAAIVVGVSLRLGRKSVDDLLDSVPSGLQEKVIAAAQKVPGVQEVRQLRLRRSGPAVFADVTLTVGRAAAFERAHDIAHEVEAAVHAVIPKSDVVIHVEPVTASQEDLSTTVRLLAARHGLGAHGIRICEENRQRGLELHLEVSDALLLDEAHRLATEFERALRQTIPDLKRIVTHIEPVGDATATIHSERAARAEVQKAVDAFLSDAPLRVRPHSLRVQQVGAELSVSLHCALDATTAITEAHDLTVRLEEYLRAHVPGLGRVVIHVEPGRKGEAGGRKGEGGGGRAEGETAP